MKKLSHTDNKGKANMVDVGNKPIQLRIAKASGKIILADETIALIRNNEMKKGDVLTLAEVAGIQAAKKTSELIPLCHPLILNKIDVSVKIIKGGISAESTVKCSGQTGVEMEALNAVSISLLTIYDMCKAVDKNMVIHDIKLIEKTKSDL
jgi:cyclic pyranopterin phosphate synthase